MSNSFVDPHEFDSITTIKDLLTKEYSTIQDKSCVNTHNDYIIMDDVNSCIPMDYNNSAGSFKLVPYFVDERGTVSFDITNTVNGLVKYNASNDKHLEYKITVKNKGDITSTNNIIITYVPEKVEVDEDSISDSGEYDSEHHSITWVIDQLEAQEETEFSYNAIVDKDINGEELIGHSTVESDQTMIATYSNNTIVSLDKIVEIITNPNTGITMVYVPNTNIGVPVSLFFMVLIAFILTGMVIIKKKIHKKYF